MSRQRQLLDALSHHTLRALPPFMLEPGGGLTLTTVGGEQLVDWAGVSDSRLVPAAPIVARGPQAPFPSPEGPTEALLEGLKAYREAAPRRLRGDLHLFGSASEAVEAMVLAFINLHVERGRHRAAPPRVVCFEGACHGRSWPGLGLSSLPQFSAQERTVSALFTSALRLPWPGDDASWATTEQMLTLHRDALAGVIVEPLQSLGGVRVTPTRVLQKLSALCHELELPLGFDEAETGGGLTGSFFYVDALDLPHAPFAVAAGKRLGNGVLYLREPLRECTALGSSRSAHVAHMLRFADELAYVRAHSLLETVPRRAEILSAMLHALVDAHADVFSAPRGVGLLQGFTVRTPTQRDALVRHAFERERLLLAPSGLDAIRLRPTLEVTAQNIETLSAQLARLARGLDSA